MQGVKIVWDGYSVSLARRNGFSTQDHVSVLDA
jgi:hypothetical protein